MSTERHTFFSSPFFFFTQTHYAVPEKEKEMKRKWISWSLQERQPSKEI